VFGGTVERNEAVAHVQVYSPAQQTCTLLDIPMPRAYLGMEAVMWDTSVILLGCETCFIYNFETQTWQEREQFKTEVDFFASTLDNSTVFIAGGGINMRHDDNKSICTCTNVIKSVSVLDIIDDKPAVWNQHAKLHKAAIISAYFSVSLPSKS